MRNQTHIKILASWLLLFIMPTVGSDVEKSDTLDQAVHLLLTREEKRMVFGSHTKIPDYELIHPKQVPQHRFRRFPQLHEQEDERMFVTLATKNEEVLISLLPNRDLAIRNMKVTIMDDNYIERYATSEHPECHFHGKIVGRESSAVALSTCNSGEMKGIVLFSPDDHYIISPLPSRFRRHLNGSVDSHHPHVLYKFFGDSFDELNLDLPLAYEPQEVRREGRYGTKRIISQPLTVELAVFVDSHLYSTLYEMYPDDVVEKIIEFVFTLVNGVQLFYYQPSLKLEVNFVVVGIYIIKSRKDSLPSSRDVHTYLSDFSKFQCYNNPRGDDNPDHWDHAVLLTSLDLYIEDPESNAVAGVAWVGRMCHCNGSSSIMEAVSYNAVIIMAHEIGHNFGIDHDGDSNDCDGDTYLMSPFLDEGKTTWSKCSDQQMRKFLSTSQFADCLFDAASSTSDLDHRSHLLPGERASATRQCVLSFGNKYKPYIANEKPFNDVCYSLWCHNNRYAKRTHPALDGTSCALNKICFYGKCVPEEDVKDRLKAKGFLIDNNK